MLIKNNLITFSFGHNWLKKMFKCLKVDALGCDLKVLSLLLQCWVLVFVEPAVAVLGFGL